MKEEDIHIHLTPSYRREIEERAEKKLIEEFLKDYREVRTALVGVKIPYGIIIKIDSLEEKWEQRLKDAA